MIQRFYKDEQQTPGYNICIRLDAQLSTPIKPPECLQDHDYFFKQNHNPLLEVLSSTLFRHVGLFQKH